VFEGFLFEPDGAPAQGAVVVTSAGGRSVVERDGRYRLEARVPLAARRVRITASGRDEPARSASASVEVSNASMHAWVVSG
jgi:hypothetical protein